MTVGLMLTLASLVGTFFYIHLSQWLRDLLALRQKAQLNRLAGDENQKRAIVECRVEYRKLATWHTYVVNLLVIAFVVFVLADALLMIQYAKTDQVYFHVKIALIVFFILFLVLSLGLIGIGFHNARQTKKLLDQVT